MLRFTTLSSLTLSAALLVAAPLHAQSSASGAYQAAGLPSGFNFGSNKGEYANDDDCDDARFHTNGDAQTYKREHVLADAADCQAAVAAGTATLVLDFGDDSGDYANDGECDDNRFTGAGRSILTTDSHVRADATDCIAAYRAGTIDRPGIMTTDLVFGNNSGSYANDDDCDDARFHDDGDDYNYKREHVLADASDCRAAVNSGEVSLLLDFGNDSGEYANDGECDDNRFTGAGRSALSSDSHVMADASDCIEAYREGNLNRGATALGDLVFGNNSGSYANDDDCDDARFHDDGDDYNYKREHVLADASDCRAAVNSGEVSLLLDFGNDSGEYANDGECDDNRFTGEGRSVISSNSHVRADASDCVAAYRAGTINRSAGAPVGGIRYGNNSGSYANDNDCDDARFHSDGDNYSYKRQHVLADANDCRAAVAAGEVRLLLDFGNDSGSYANDGECDDNRFTGEGRSVISSNSHVRADASDCVAAYRAGDLDR